MSIGHVIGCIFNSFAIEYYFEPLPDLSLRIEKRENEIGKKFDDLQRQNRLLMAKILLMENEKILQDSNEIVQVQEQKDSEIITKESVHKVRR